jgi:hypothetical protein
MKAKVIAKTTINSVPAQIGDVVEVDENTFRNLARKGRLAEATEDTKPQPKKEGK